MKKQFSFDITYQSQETKARLGVIHTPHGDIQTPAFVPVGTQATVKSLTPEEVKTVGTQLFFVNTYHMAMRPGIEVVKQFGGLHAFMKWDGPIITDSGGFQVFSLAKGDTKQEKSDKNDEREPSLVKITENGVEFRSHWDGAYHEFTPEISMQYQWELGSDIHIAFDDCTPYPVSPQEARISMERTHRWAVRSLEEHKKLKMRYPDGSRDSYKISPEISSQVVTEPAKIPHQVRDDRTYQALYGSVQGSVFEDLRKASASFISSLDVDGIAIGGVSVGESKAEMTRVLDWTIPLLPKEKPRHLLGVGEIDDIFMSIEKGIDTFDCVLPTRMARGGYLYNTKNILDINKAEFAQDVRPINEHCGCYTCQTFSRGYLHHLFKVRELLGYRLATIHNLTFIHELVRTIRTAIKENRFLELRAAWGYTTR